MSRKSIIVFVLAAAAVAAALVFDGVSHRNRSNNQPVPQNQMTATASTDASTNSSNPGTEAQAAVPDPNAANQAGPDAVTGDDPPAQNGDDAAAGEGAADDAPQSNADAAQPAADPIVVPAGTTLTVRLGEELGSSVSRANQRFSAILDRDVVVHGQTVIAAGATVTGRVVAAKPAGPLTGEAKLQLKITSVNAGNGNVSVATSTRSFGPTIKGKNKVGKFMKGLVKRAAGQEREVLLAEQSACSFTLQRRLEIQ